MIDVVNKLNASILIPAIDLLQYPITVWTEVTLSLCLRGKDFCFGLLSTFFQDVSIELDSLGLLCEGQCLYIKWLQIMGNGVACTSQLPGSCANLMSSITGYINLTVTCSFGDS